MNGTQYGSESWKCSATELFLRHDAIYRMNRGVCHIQWWSSLKLNEFWNSQIMGERYGYVIG